ncbi:MAG TPA: tetratricopeptide repeat protein, partial [Verrucomicrobiae bacterium]|nr:tetratricopeptide repeat protein [Verrucomicrobiae bacterium]
MTLKRDFSTALPKARQALQLAEKAHGKNHLRAAVSQNHLGFIHLNLNQLSQAESLLTRAVKIFSNNPSADRAEYVQALNSLAHISLAVHQPARAETLYTRALALSQRPPITDSLQLAQSLNNLAGLYLQLRKY